MTSILAIAKTTILFSFRSYWFQIALIILFFCVVGIPLIVVGDGTAEGQFQISVTYTLGFLKTFLACSTICLGCYSMATDIESWKIHLIVTKPAKGYTIWFGKWLGVLGVHFLLLLLTSTVVYCLINWKLRSSEFSGEELRKLDSEILVGRKLYSPFRKDSSPAIQDEINLRIRKGQIPRNANKQELFREIGRQVKLRNSEIWAKGEKIWDYINLRLENPLQSAHLRYRIFLDSSSSRGQRETFGIWRILNVKDGKYYPHPQRIISGKFNEIRLSSEAFSKTGSVSIKYENQDPLFKSVFFHQDDGPFILVEICGFLQNYFRVILLFFLQLVFLATLGCTAGSILSLPMAIFISSSYIILGILVVMLQFTFPEHDNVQSSSLFTDFTVLVRTATAYATFPLSEFNGTHLLVKGELIEVKKILAVFFQNIILRAFPIGVLGMWQISRRELGLVERK